MTSSVSAFKVSARLRTRRHRFHLDMTPMVGLAFLLLTFFLLHAGVAKPRVLPIIMPSADNPANKHFGCFGGGMSGAMTIILGKNHQLYYYPGVNNPLDSSSPVPELGTTDFGPQGIRHMLLIQRSQQPEPVILIKPAPGATYKDMVDILDEMKITGQRQYALVPITAADRQLLRANGQQ